MADMYEGLLGNEHPGTLRCRLWLCKVLRVRGSLEESENCFNRPSDSRLELEGTERGHDRVHGGSEHSSGSDEEDGEAEMWMKRAVCCSQQIGGVKSMRTTRFWMTWEDSKKRKGNRVL